MYRLIVFKFIQFCIALSYKINILVLDRNDPEEAAEEMDDEEEGEADDASTRRAVMMGLDILMGVSDGARYSDGG